MSSTKMRTFLAVTIIITPLIVGAVPTPRNPANGLPRPDCSLHLYALPIGNGEANIIQCPVTGDLTIIDMGSVSRNGQDGNELFWDAGKVKDWLNGKVGKVKNVLISHRHSDEGNYLDDVLPLNEISDVDVYISCLESEMTGALDNWKQGVTIHQIGTATANATLCNAADDPCVPGSIQICKDYYLDILAANQGHCGSSPDGDSIVVKLRHSSLCGNGNVSVLLTGDLSGAGLNRFEAAFEDTPEVFRSTIYKLARHGTEDGNDVNFMNLVDPEAIFVNSNPWRTSWHHPHCETTYDSDSEPTKQFQLKTTPFGQDTYFCSTAASRANKAPLLQNTGGKAIHTTVSGENGATLNVIEFIIKSGGKAWESHSWPVAN